MKDNLYQKPPLGAFTTFCGGNQQEENQESCVSVGEIDGGVILRDTKPEGAGRELRFSHGEIASFVRGYAIEHGLSL